MTETRNAYMTGYRARSERGMSWETSVANGTVRGTVENREAFMTGYRGRNQRGMNWETYKATLAVEVPTLKVA